MQHQCVTHSPLRKSLASMLFAAAALFGVATAATLCTHRCVVGLSVNVTMPSGYNFTSADTALSYGKGLYAKVSHSRSYARFMGDVKADSATSNEYQAPHLTSQAVDELCPALIWQLRNCSKLPANAAGG